MRIIRPLSQLTTTINTKQFATVGADIAAIGGNGTVVGAKVTYVTGANTRLPPIANRLIIVSIMCSAAGVGTTVQECSINGVQMFVDVQANTGGALAAIVSCTFPIFPEDGILRVNVLLSASGATGARIDLVAQSGHADNRPLSVQADQTTADTTRTITFPTRYIGSITMCAAVNDVATANSCTWTGTAAMGEVSDATIGTYKGSASRIITAPAADIASATAIATFAASSVAGIVLVGATWR